MAEAVTAYSFAVALERVESFQGGKIQVASAGISTELRSVHRQATDIAGKHGIAIDPYYQEKQWHPHCTIAQEATRNFDRSIEFSLMKVTVSKLVVVHYPPTTVILSRTLLAKERRYL